MANVKNFGLAGVGSDLQLGKGGVRVVAGEGTFSFRAANGTTAASVSASSVTASTGDLTATLGNLALSAANATIGVAGDTTLSRQAAGVFKFDGAAAFMAPIGNDAARPTGVSGMIRASSQGADTAVEYFDGTVWRQFANTATTSAIQTEIDNIETSLGGMIATDGTYVGSSLTNTDLFGTTGAGATNTSLTAALNNLATYVTDHNTLDEIFPSLAAGNVIYADATGWQQAGPGATSGVQAYLGFTPVNKAGDSMDLNASLTFSGTGTVTGLPTPVNGSDAANKNYVDNAITGLSWKQAVAVLANTNINLASAPSAIDGITLAIGNRVLVAGQTTGSENGIYVFNGAGSAMTRSADADTYQELNGAAVFVQQGTQYENTGWTQNTELSSFAGQDWVQFSGAGAYTAGDGIAITGNEIATVVGDGLTYATGAITLNIATTTALTKSAGAGADQLALVISATGALTDAALGLAVNTDGVTVYSNASNNLAVKSSGTQYQTLISAGSGDAAWGAISLDQAAAVSGTLGVTNGGTGLSTMTAGQLLIGGSGTAAVVQDADLAFDAATNTLTVGSATLAGTAAGDVTLTATGTNADINLVPNGTGKVVVGAAAADGVIASDAGYALTVTGGSVLTLGSTTGDTTMSLAASDAYKVTISGPTAAQYATGLAAEDLTNKQYVDDAIASGAAAGAVKAFQAVVSLNGSTAVNVGTAMPAGSTVLSVKVNVTSAADAGTLVVGKSGSTSAYMADGENDTSATGLYVAECFVTETGAVQVVATPAGGTSGSATVIVTYQVAQ